MVGARKRAQVNYAEDAGYADRTHAYVQAISAAPCAWSACGHITEILYASCRPVLDSDDDFERTEGQQEAPVSISAPAITLAPGACRPACSPTATKPAAALASMQARRNTPSKHRERKRSAAEVTADLDEASLLGGQGCGSCFAVPATVALPG